MSVYRFKYPVYALVLSAALVLTLLDTSRVVLWSNAVGQPLQWWYWFSVKGVFYLCWSCWLLVLWYGYTRFGYQRHSRAALSWRYLSAVLIIGVCLPAVMALIYLAWAIPGARQAPLSLLYQDVWLHYGYHSLLIGVGLAILLWLLPGFYSTGKRDAPQRNTLTVNQRGQVIPVAVTELDWVQADGNYVTLHTRQGAYPLRRNISSLADELAPKGFLRVHRSALVNRASITRLYRVAGQWRVALESGDSAPVSRRRIQDIKAKLAGVTVHNHPSTGHPSRLVRDQQP